MIHGIGFSWKTNNVQDVLSNSKGPVNNVNMPHVISFSGTINNVQDVIRTNNELHVFRD